MGWGGGTFSSASLRTENLSGWKPPLKGRYLCVNKLIQATLETRKCVCAKLAVHLSKTATSEARVQCM